MSQQQVVFVELSGIAAARATVRHSRWPDGSDASLSSARVRDGGRESRSQTALHASPS